MSLLARQTKLFQRTFARELAQATPVELRWVEYSADAQFDPVTQALASGVVTPRALTVRAMTHEVAPAQVVLDDFAELEAGDCIADFAPDAPLDGKLELKFVIGGQVWEQKRLSSKLALHYDAIVGGKKLTRTIVLKKAT